MEESLTSEQSKEEPTSPVVLLCWTYHSSVLGHPGVGDCNTQ